MGEGIIIRKIIIVFLVSISFLILLGYSNIQIGNGKTPKLVYNKSTEKEEFLINLMGNEVLSYELKNLSKDKNYEILLSYEVYEKGEKIKEEIITSVRKNSISDKDGDKKIGINFQDDKIRFGLEQNGDYIGGAYDLKEDLSKYAKTYFMSDADLKIGTEFYIYYAAANLLSEIPLGVPIDEGITSELANSLETNILIKLSYKEK